MENQKQPQFKLLQLTPIEAKEEFDEKCERCYGFVQNIISGVSEAEAHDSLNNTVCKSAQAHEEVCLGLLVSILTEPDNASRYYRDLTYVSRDGLALVIRDLNVIILERYLKLDETSRFQLIWVLKEVLRNNINGADSLIYNLLRQIAGGDVSAKNTWLAESVLDLLIENRFWLERHSILIATVVYTYLRLIVDHSNSLYINLKQKEVDFCICLLREKFCECLLIGRDLVRLLQNVARIPEFEALWKDILNNPTVLSPNFSGLLQLMQTRTSRRFLQCRLTPDMERKITYLTSHVKFGQQKRFQEWFQKRYLSTPESQTLRCDLIRFICGVIHPTNEVLNSDIIPRWAVIGWILSSCTSSVAASNAKLSLFYDWLFFDAEKDNIMNIEPAILVMFQSVKTHPVITVTLLDFLCRIITNFYPPYTHLIRKGVYTAFNLILEKKVISSLLILFENQKIDGELRQLVRESFPEFCNPLNEIQLLQQSNMNMQPFIISENNGFSNTNGLNNLINHNMIVIDDDIKCLNNVNLEEEEEEKKIYSIYEKSYEPNFDFNLIIDLVNNLTLKNSLISLKKEVNKEKRYESMGKFVKLLLQEELDQTTLTNIAKCLVLILKDDLTKKIYTKNNNYLDENEQLKESVKLPIFVLLNEVIQLSENDPSKEVILSILNEISLYTKCIGYLIIYLIKVTKTNDNNMSAYREYFKFTNKDLNECLLRDLQTCQFEELDMFCFIIIDVFKVFSNICINNSEIIYLIVNCVDSLQLQEFICHIIQGNLTLFKKESFLSVINASLEWETFEQFCLWQFIEAHDISLDYILPVLPKLEYQANSEALARIMLMLKNEEPTDELLKHILNRDYKKFDYFTISVLKCWARDYADKLAELLSAQLIKNLSGNIRGKKKTATKTSISWSAEQILIHLDFYREKCKDTLFFNNELIQNALTTIQAACNDSQKIKFNDLFSLIDDNVQWNNKEKKKDSKKVKKKRNRKDSSSDSDLSQDEVTSSPNKSKLARKKKQKTVLSDSE